MATDTTYNGWTNYPTWCVNLWLSNDEGLSEAARELAANAVGGSYVPDGNYTGAARVAVADALKDWVCGELAPDLGASFAADLLGYALDSVDWFEIADAWVEIALNA